MGRDRLLASSVLVESAKPFIAKLSKTVVVQRQTAIAIIATLQACLRDVRFPTPVYSPVMVLVLEPPQKIAVLVIDDEPHVTELMPEIFSDMPIHVVVARDAKTG